MIDIRKINQRITKLDKLITLYQLEVQSLKDLRDVYTDPAYDEVGYEASVPKEPPKKETPTLDPPTSNIKEYQWLNKFLDEHPELEDTISRCFDSKQIKLTRSANEAKLYSVGVNTYIKFIKFMVRLGYITPTLNKSYYSINKDITKLRKWPYEFE